mmetsp:Transcript_17179/g.31132  ORF Transcript_17179/g.31132 Transcript_17179/m.31132 type:complete len:217 (-) Transcript_17179:7-657(-)
MLVEFRKLERQLLGAPVNVTTNANNNNNPKTAEAAGSKERREKLHGFILHFEDTIRQITEGCVLEEQERKKEREQHQQQLLDEKTAAGNDTQQPDDNKSQSLPTDQFTAAEASLSHLTPASSTPTTGTVTDPTKRRILYTGIAPGSTQLPSSINAVTGVRPNFISEDAARAVAVAEDEQKQMERRRMRRGLRWGRPRAASNRRQKQRREQQHRRQK